METVAAAHGLVKRYKGKVAVDGLTLEVPEGQTVALLGPNGAGKTTTLMMLLGVISPDEGWVELGGHRLPQQRSQGVRHVGFSAGYMPLAERLRVREFLAMYARLYEVTDPSKRIEEELDRFGISELAEAMGTELSSGQRTLVGIVKATLHRPRLIVLDEPTASLDPDVAQRVRHGLTALNSTRGTALLITSHNMLEIERLCERVVFLASGKVIADDTPAGVVRRFGRADLEGVFLHLAGSEANPPDPQKTDRPA